MDRYDNLQARDRSGATPARRAGLPRQGGVLAALALASCLPLEDLSRYSRGDAPAPDAGAHQFTTATPELEPGRDPPSRPPRADAPSAPEDDADAPGGSAPQPTPPPTRPGPIADAGSSSPGLPEGCVERPGTDAGVGSCYVISREPSSWSEALAACARWGGSLVSINSAAESDWLAASVDVTIWIGANDRELEGTFGWANADPFQFELFAAGEPDNTFGLQDCVERRVDSSWNDRACNVDNPFVCERPL